MSAKTYIPKLYLVVKTVVRYAGRWREPLRDSLTSQQNALLDALLEAAEALIAAIDLVIES